MSKKGIAPSKSRGISRRDFGRRIGWTAATAAVFPSSLVPLGEDKAIFRRGLVQAGPELTSESRLRVENQLRSILDRYPSRFRQKDVTELRHILTRIERILVKVRAFPLQNGDPSANVLKLYRGEDTAKVLVPAVSVHRDT